MNQQMILRRKEKDFFGQSIFFILLCNSKCFCMEEQQSLKELQHIRQMMERSSRFISLSGLSGIAAGVCALAGAWFAWTRLQTRGYYQRDLQTIIDTNGIRLLNDLLWIGTLTFVAAFVLAFIFTYLKSKKEGVPMWGAATIRLFWNTAIPVAVGGIFILRLIDFGAYELVAPACLIFYGLALVNGSKYTLGEVRFLGYGMLALGLLNLWFGGYGLYFWAMGFGILHIVYGAAMWYKYDRHSG